MCEVLDKIENRGKQEGMTELAAVINLLKAGKTETDILNEGYPQETINLAKTLR